MPLFVLLYSIPKIRNWEEAFKWENRANNYFFLLRHTENSLQRTTDVVVLFVSFKETSLTSKMVTYLQSGDQKWPFLRFWQKEKLCKCWIPITCRVWLYSEPVVEVRSTRANTLMAQTFRSSNKHIICSRNRQLRWVARCWVLYMSRCKSMAKPLWIVIGCCKYICKAIQ